MIINKYKRAWSIKCLNNTTTSFDFIGKSYSGSKYTQYKLSKKLKITKIKTSFVILL